MTITDLNNSTVSYSNNKEYRQCVREFCNMNCLFEPDTILELDEESVDELMFDETSTKKTLDNIFEKTKDDPLWQKLYEKAAGKFISMDHEIGLCVLFSYDYFDKFNECWNDYLVGSSIHWNENNSSYKKLWNAL